MRRPWRFPGLLLTLAFTSLLPSQLQGQGEEPPPAFLRDKALVVRFLALAFDHPLPAELSQAGKPDAGQPPASAKKASAVQAPGLPAWTSKSLRYTMSGSPVAIRLAGEDLVIVVQVTPYENGSGGLRLVAQGQVWRRGEDGKLDYRSVFETLSVDWGERVFFYPLGRRLDGATLISLEIAVDRFGDPSSIPDSAEGSSAKSETPAPGKP